MISYQHISILLCQRSGNVIKNCSLVNNVALPIIPLHYYGNAGQRVILLDSVPNDYRIK